MVRQDDWADRNLSIEFISEQPSKGHRHKVRKFKKISGDASPQQILRFSKAVSRLTPNGNGAILTDMYDHFLYDPEAY